MAGKDSKSGCNSSQRLPGGFTSGGMKPSRGVNGDVNAKETTAASNQRHSGGHFAADGSSKGEAAETVRGPDAYQPNK